VGLRAVLDAVESIRIDLKEIGVMIWTGFLWPTIRSIAVINRWFRRRRGRREIS
jgi:hypothetical protein